MVYPINEIFQVDVYDCRIPFIEIHLCLFDGIVCTLPGTKAVTVIRKFLLDGVELKKKMAPGDYYQPLKGRTDLENRLKKLLASRIDENHKELVSFQKRMLKYKDFILTFLLEARITYRVDVRGLPPERFTEAADAYRAVLTEHRYRVLSETKRPDRGRICFIFRSAGRDTRQHIEGLFDEAIDVSLRGSLDWEVD